MAWLTDIGDPAAGVPALHAVVSGWGIGSLVVGVSPLAGAIVGAGVALLLRRPLSFRLRMGASLPGSEQVNIGVRVGGAGSEQVPADPGAEEWLESIGKRRE